MGGDRFRARNCNGPWIGNRELGVDSPVTSYDSGISTSVTRFRPGILIVNCAKIVLE